MRRTGFKQKLTVPMKRGKLRKESKQKISLLKRKLWELCKQVVRKRDGNICVICYKSGLEGSSWHTGHFLPSSVCGAFLRFDLRNLHSSCYNCNINLGGNGAMFLLALETKYGRSFVESVVMDKQKTIKADNIFYEEKIKEYEEIQNWDKDKLLDHTRNYRNRDL